MAIPIQPTGCQPDTLNSCNEIQPSSNTYPQPGKNVVTQDLLICPLRKRFW